MMDFSLKMMNVVFKMMNFVLKMHYIHAERCRAVRHVAGRRLIYHQVMELELSEVMVDQRYRDHHVTQPARQHGEGISTKSDDF